ncbi:uncharacterized protein PG986_000476 [Apiospora aurea]|uniref:F-box domain-containing protein n=1 Tax=Apiospora aurea TaxID=335848 RepID=A0ABR1QU48_9PEZI
MALVSLPTELLQHICREFCLHCQLADKEHNKSVNDKIEWQYDEETVTADAAVVMGVQNARLIQLKQRDEEEWRTISEDRLSLLNLCRTCSVLRTIARPYLYHRLAFRTAQWLRLFDLLWNLLRTPDLAACVRYLALGPEANAGEAPIWTEDIIERLFHFARRSIRLDPDTAEDPEVPANRRTVHIVKYPLLSQLIVARTHSLELLALSGELAVPWNLLAYVDPGKCSMPRLRGLRLSGLDTPYDLADYAYLLRLAPNLAKLSITGCNGVSRKLELANLQTLSLVNTQLDRTDMDLLLSSCRALRTFSALFVWSRGAGVPEIVDLLVQHGHGRTLLDLAFVASISDREVWREDGEAIRSLAGFERLERLVLDNRYVVEITAPEHDRYLLPTAPGTLRSIQLNGAEHRFLDELDRLADRKADGMYPHLTDVVVVSPDSPVGEWSHPRCEEILNRMAGLGMPLTEDELKRPQWVEDL